MSSRTTLLSALGLLAISSSLGAQGSFTQLSERSWIWLAADDRSSNSALFVGDDAALLVDPGLTPGIAREVLAEARRTARKPVRYVVTTHWHPDHSLGVACMTDRQFTVIAHPATARNLSERGPTILQSMAQRAENEVERDDLENCTLQPPDSLVTDRVSIDLGGHTVEVFHPGAAHTQGDLVVWSEEEKTIATGDVFMHESSPSMGEGSALTWINVLYDLIRLEPEHAVAGHFGPSGLDDLTRFRDYMSAQINRARMSLAAGVAPDEVGEDVDFADFADFADFEEFAQYPQYGATFANNATTVAQELAPQISGDSVSGFRTLAVLDVGDNPHQIAFSHDEQTAYIAVAGEDRIALVDSDTYEIESFIETPGVPLGVFELPEGNDIAITRFRSEEIARYSPTGELISELRSGGGASLFTPLPGNRYLVSVEQTDQLWVVDAERFALQIWYPTGDRPFPPAATSDGRLAFVPSYNDGNVTIINLETHENIDTVHVGTTPSGGAMLPGDREYAVAVRGDDKIVFIDTETFEITGELTAGIGDSPFSVVVSVDGRYAFVNNTFSHDVSVIALPEKEVIARIPVGEIPIVIGVHPDGETLWVSSEGSHTLSIIAIPRQVQSSTVINGVQGSKRWYENATGSW